MPRTMEMLPTPAEACSKILALAGPLEPIEVSLVDALGLVLAEDAVADVDLPPFDRSTTDGYAVRGLEAVAGALLRVAGLRWSNRPLDDSLESGEAIRVDAGDPLPVGDGSVVKREGVRADPDTGPTRVIEILKAVNIGQEVARRGHLLEAGAVIGPAGTRLTVPMVGLLASQGCVHPVCHRRVRVAVLAVGDHLVRPTEAPVMHRERNACNPSIVAQALRAGAMPHDLLAVSDTQFSAALERATSAPVIVILGPNSRSIQRTLKSFGVERVLAGVAMKPGGQSRYYVIRDERGEVVHHIFHLSLSPMAASSAFAMLVQPLIARLQGGPAAGPKTFAAIWDGTHRATDDRLRIVPVTLAIDTEARLRARPSPLRGHEDLPGYARAEGLALLPARSGPWLGGELVEVIRLD